MNVNSTNDYKERYINELKKELESLKIKKPISNSDAEEIDEIISDIPKIDYQAIINSLVKLKVQDVEKPHKLLDDKKEMDINIVDNMNFVIPEFNEQFMDNKKEKKAIDIDKFLDELREKRNKETVKNNWMKELYVSTNNDKKINVDNQLTKDEIIIEQNRKEA